MEIKKLSILQLTKLSLVSKRPHRVMLVCLFLLQIRHHRYFFAHQLTELVFYTFFSTLRGKSEISEGDLFAETNTPYMYESFHSGQSKMLSKGSYDLSFLRFQTTNRLSMRVKKSLMVLV